MGMYYSRIGGPQRRWDIRVQNFVCFDDSIVTKGYRAPTDRLLSHIFW